MSRSRNAKGSINDRIISMIYRIRYKKKNLKKENYTIDKKEKQLTYIKKLEETKNINSLDIEDKKILDDVKINTTYRRKKKVGIASINEEKTNKIIKEKIALNKETYKTSESFQSVIDKRLSNIENKTIELDEKVDLKKEIKKTKNEIVILKEVDKFIKTSKENINKIDTEVKEIKKDLKEKNKSAEEIEKRYIELKKKIDKLKKQYDTIKDKYDLSDFSIIESIKIIDSIEDYKKIANINEIEMMVNVCKNEINKIEGITIIDISSKKLGSDIEENKDKENKVKIRFNKSKEKTNDIKTMEEKLADELKEQQKIIDEMYSKASYFEKEVTKEIEYIGHRKILSSLVRIAGGILTVPFTGSKLFGIALGSTMINKGLKELNRTLETREKIVINYKYEDISKKIDSVKDKLEYTNLNLIDSLSEIGKLKINFKEIFKDYKIILPEYQQIFEKINLLEKNLLEQQSKLNKMYKKLDEEKEINVKFPEEYFSKDLAGKDAMFKVKLHEIKMKELPKLDDEFAKDVSEFDTIADLKADLKAKKEVSNAEKAKSEMEEAAVNAACDVSEVEISDGMVEVELDNMVQDMDKRLSYQGIKFEQYLQMLGKTMETFRKDNRETAVKSIKMRLVLEAVYKDSKLEVSDKEVKEKITELATTYGRKEEDLNNNEELLEHIKANIKSEKAIKEIVDNAKIKTVEPKEEKKEASKTDEKAEETKTTTEKEEKKETKKTTK